MIIQRYPDGSELSLGMLVGAIGVGAICSAALILLQDKLEGRRWRKYMENIEARQQNPLK